MQFDLCRHIKTNGIRCKSPSLGLSAFCYFHGRTQKRHRSLRESGKNPPETAPHSPSTVANVPEVALPPLELDLPLLEDAEAIQVSISLIIAALASNRLDSKRAAVLLYGLQLASSNVRAVNTQPYAPSVIRSITRTRSGIDLANDESAAPL